MTAPPPDGWRDIASAPKDEEVELLLDNGKVAVGEYWPAPPIEIDPEQTWGGWAIRISAFDIHEDVGEPVSWRPITPDSPQ